MWNSTLQMRATHTTGIGNRQYLVPRAYCYLYWLLVLLPVRVLSLLFRFAWGLGMQLVAKSDQSTGNSTFASYVLRSNDLVFAFTAPYGSKMAAPAPCTSQPWFNQDRAFDFLKCHGLAVRAVGMVVYHTCGRMDILVMYAYDICSFNRRDCCG